MRRAVPAPTLLPRAAAILLFMAAFAVLALKVQPLIREALSPPRPAQGPTYLLNTSRTATVDTGSRRYEILGLGQNADSGAQVVWVRSLRSNRIGGFAAGQRLFGGPVRVAIIDGVEVELASGESRHRVRLAP